MEDIFSRLQITAGTIIYESDPEYQELECYVQETEQTGRVCIGSAAHQGYNYVFRPNRDSLVVFYTNPSQSGYQIMAYFHAIAMIAVDVAIELEVPRGAYKDLGEYLYLATRKPKEVGE